MEHIHVRHFLPTSVDKQGQKDMEINTLTPSTCEMSTERRDELKPAGLRARAA